MIKNSHLTSKIEISQINFQFFHNAIYFNKIQPYQHKRFSMKGLYSYSFSLNPNHLQPSSTCNMSRIEKAQMFLNLYKQLSRA